MVSGGSVDFDVSFRRASIDDAISVLRRRVNNVGAFDLDINLGRDIDSEIQQLRRRLANVRDVRIGVELDSGDAIRELRRLRTPDIRPSVDSGPIRGLGQIATGIFQGVGQEITQSITSAISSGVGAGFSTLRNAAGFEAALVAFESRAGGAADITAQVADEARRLGIETSKTPEEVARIATRMVELGGETDEVASNVAGVVAALEGTGFTNIDATAKAIQAGTNVFNESADAFADKITILANTTAVTSAESILQALGKAGGAFVAADESASVLLATFAEFSTTSTPEVAATATRNALEKLQAPTDKARAALESLNVSVFENGEPRQFLDVMDDLSAALGDISTEDAKRQLNDIFGSRSASQIQLLLRNLDDVRAKTEELEGSLGAAGEASDNLNQGVAAGLNRLQGTLVTAGTDFGLALGPAIESGIRGLTGAINSAIADGDAFADTTASVERLLEAAEGSGTIDAVGESIRRLFDAADSGIAELLNEITEALTNDPEAIARGIDDVVTTIIELATTIKLITTEIGELAENVSGFINVLDSLGLAKGFDEFRNSQNGAFAELQTNLSETSGSSVSVGFNGTFDGPLSRLLGIAEEETPVTIPLSVNSAGVQAGIDGIQAAIGNLNTNTEEQSKQDRLDAAAALAAQVGDVEVDGVRQSEVEKERIRDEALSKLESEQTAALSRLARSESDQIAAIRRNQLAGGTSTEAADAAVNDVQVRAARERAQIAETEASELARLQEQGVISAEDATAKIASAKEEASELAVTALDREIAGQKEAADAAERRAKEESEAAKKRIEDELSARERLNSIRSQQVNLESGLGTSGLQDQLSVAQAQASLDQSRLSLSRRILDAKLSEAEATEDAAGIESARDRILLNQLGSVQTEFNARRQQLAIQQQLTQLDSQRQVALAEIAESEARIAVDRARSRDNTTDEELSGLERITALRESDTDRIRQQLSAQEEILDIQLEQLSIDEEIANQQAIAERRNESIQAALERQKDLSEERRDLEKDLADQTERQATAAGNIVSALSGLQDVSAEDALGNLDQLEENLRTARRAGVLEGDQARELQRTINQAQRLGRGGFTVEEGLRFAANNEGNAFAGGILDSVGLGGVNSLIESQQEFSLAESQIATLSTEIQAVKSAIQELVIPVGVQNLTVATPDPAGDTATILADMARAKREAAGVS